MACYPGPNPIDKDDPEGLRRAGIWAWVKEHGIDQGKSFDEIHDMINQKVFHGSADTKPEWITDILSGRKTPFHKVATEAWRAQNARKAIVQQAKDVAGRAAMPMWYRGLSKAWETPRALAVAGHGYVFPITHAGDMVLNPWRWGILYRGLKNVWTKSHSAAETEKITNTMQKDDMFNMALNDGADLSPRAHGSDLTIAGKQSSHAYEMLKVMRFELYKHEMTKFLAKNPDMSPQEQREMGKYVATMANHATGSGRGMLTSSKAAGELLFGSKLTQSKINRMAEAVKTAGTYLNWDAASPVQKAAARTHLSQMTAFATTYAGFLAANQGFLWATGQKDKDGKPTQINWKDPTKSDWMKFKVGGLEAGIPGIHSELKALGAVLMSSYMAYKWSDPKFVAQQKALGVKKPFHPPNPLDELVKYGRSKLSPTAGIGADVLTGQDFSHHPVPWSPDPGKPAWPRMEWAQYGIAHAPIPLSGPIRYVYDQFRTRGMSALDATTIIKTLIITAVGATGIHIGEDYQAAKVKH